MSENSKFDFKPVIIGLVAGFVVLALTIAGLALTGSGPKQNNQAQPSTSTSASSSASPSATASLEPCLVTEQAANSKLGALQALVVRADNSQVLFNKDETKASATASALKLLTSAVALQTLGPNYRIETKVFRDASDPSVIYLVGGGDPTLSRTGPGKESVYKKAPKLSELAIQVNSAMAGTQITKIVADSSLFAGDQWLSSWERSEQTIGYHSQVSALQVDGDRDNPAKETSPRSTTPELRAGDWFKQAIGALAANASVEQGVTPAGSTQIASVKSQPLSQWIGHMLQMSDNTQAEVLARLVALQSGGDGSFASIDPAYKTILGGIGLNTAALKIVDGSGLSANNAVPPTFFIELMKKIYDEEGDLRIIKQNLPTSGESGSLAYRFKGNNKVAVGHVFAKTGWIKTANTLVGYIDSADGTPLLFAIYAIGKGDVSLIRTAIDDLATGFYRCGAALSNG